MIDVLFHEPRVNFLNCFTHTYMFIVKVLERFDEQTRGVKRYRGAATEAIGLRGRDKEKRGLATANTGTCSSCYFTISTSASPSSFSFSRPSPCSFKPFSFSLATCIACKDKQLVSSTFQMPHGWHLLPQTCTWGTSIC